MAKLWNKELWAQAMVQVSSDPLLTKNLKNGKMGFQQGVNSKLGRWVFFTPRKNT